MDKSELLAKWLQQNTVDSEALEKKPKDSPNRLSFGQKRLFFLQQIYSGSPFYNYPELYTLRGDWDIELLKECIHEVCQLHGIFFHNFKLNSDHEPEIFINQERKPVLIEQLHLSDLTNKDNFREFLIEKGRYVFDLAEDILFRVTILTLSDSEHKILFNLHHIITDKWSMKVFRKQLLKLYENRIPAKEDYTLAKNKYDYLDFSHHQSNATVPEHELNYWKEKLSPPIEELSLPVDHEPSKITHDGKFNTTTFPPELSKKIKLTAKQLDTTLFTFFYSVYTILLHRYSGANTIQIGTPISNRNRKEWESLIGFFNETVLLRSRINSTLSFKSYLQEVKNDVLEAFDHKKVPFESVVSQLSQQREVQKNPLFRTMFLFHKKEMDSQPLPGLQMNFETFDIGVAKFDLTIYVEEEDENISVTFEYATDYFDDVTITRMHKHFQRLVEDIISNTSQKVCNLDILTNDEIAQFEKWNKTEVVTNPITIDDLFEQIAEQHSNAVAVTDSKVRLTYQELNKKAEALASHIVEKSPINKRIGLFLGRSTDMIVAMLASLKSGCSYVPLDPSYPCKRIQYIIEDANIDLVVTSSNLIESLNSDLKIVDIEHIGSSNKKNQKKTHTADDEAYVIYTSGSTGKPKGVSISHRNLYYSSIGRPDFYENINPTCFLLFSSFSFDSSVAGIYWTLLTGGNLLISRDRAEQHIQEVAALIQQQSVSHTLLLPSLYNVLLEETDPTLLEGLEIVIVAGEKCSTHTINQHFNTLPNTRLYNEYGPTETTVWCIAHKVSPQDTVDRVPIGHPVPGYEVHILDPNNKRVPTGVTGELFVGGKGVSNGYIGKAADDNGRFIENPFGEGKLYKTGDVASYRKNGTIDFWGRVDNQIKIRGHRVELSEIDRVLTSLTYITEAKAIYDEKKQQLLAFVSEGQVSEISEAEIKQYLLEFLPTYMIPSSIFIIENLPRLPNGKIDQKSLMGLNIQTDQVEPTSNSDTLTPVERELTEIWEEILNKPNIDIHDNFFAIGGDSISSIRLVSKAKSRGIELTPTQIFETQTIKEISTHLLKMEYQKSQFKSIVPLNPGGQKPPLFCIHSGGAHVFIYKKFAESLSADYPVYGIQPKGLDGSEMHNSIEEMALDYLKEIKSVTNERKVYLLGYCFSKVVCLEIARIAKNQDMDVELFIIDSAALPWDQRKRLIRESKRDMVVRFCKQIVKGGWRAFAKVLQRNLERVNIKFGYTTKERVEKIVLESDTKTEHDLVRIILNLNKVEYDYQWIPVQTEVHLIRSSQFANLQEKNYHIDVWKTLSDNHLSVYQVEGYHSTLFKKKSALEMARIVEKVISHEVK